MTSELLLMCCVLLLVNPSKSCFKEINHINYLFLDDMSQTKIPLLPLDCLHCQSAYQIDIQLIDEQSFRNRTIQRMKIFLKNFEIEDSSYICLITLCPILVEYGSDSILLNITSALFSHVFLSFIYLNNRNNSIVCSIQTRFAIFSLNKSLKCTEKIHSHPRLNIQISGQLFLNDCRANLFEKTIYQSSIQFHHLNFQTNNQITTMKSSGRPCEYIFDSTWNLKTSSRIQTNELFTTVMLHPLYNPWKKDIQTLGPCRTKFIPYREMFFTDDIVNIRNINIQQGQTIQIRCPIEGSEMYLKYIWYYQRYQPKYQISNNRTITLNNITEQMQGNYMCMGDDGNEKLEFEMTLHVINRTKTTDNSFHSIVIFILGIILILFCLIFILLTYFSLKKNPLRKSSKPISTKNSHISCSMDNSFQKPNSLTIHHDVMVTIRHSSEQPTTNSLWDQEPYHTLDYIDEQPIYHIPSNEISSDQLTQIPSWPWIKQSNSRISHRFSTRHLDIIGHYRNVNGQPVNLPLMQSNSDITFPPIAKFNQASDYINQSLDEIEILKISIPLLNQYPLVKSTSSVISFDSQIELEEFDQMTCVC